MTRLVRRAVMGATFLVVIALALPAVAEERPTSRTGGEHSQSEHASTPPVLAAVQVPRELTLPLDVANKVGRQVWLNETGGNSDAIVTWNETEEFLSLGIGHFIWYPGGVPVRFKEVFPHFVQFLRQQKAQLPDWLDKSPTPPCPWQTRAEFLKAKGTPRFAQLTKFLNDTKGLQTQFLVDRARSGLDIMLFNTPEETKREHIAIQFTRVINASKDLYPIIDYVNFKGEGTNPDETIFDPETKANEGWGLKQVLLGMSGSANTPDMVLGEFAESAKVVLLRRIRNQPKNQRWQEGWLKRVATYRRPLVRH